MVGIIQVLRKTSHIQLKSRFLKLSNVRVKYVFFAGFRTGKYGFYTGKYGLYTGVRVCTGHVRTQYVPCTYS